MSSPAIDRPRKPGLREVGLAAKMALSTTVSRRMKRKAPRAFLKRTFKQKKPRFRLETCCDLLVSPRGPGPHGGP